MAKYGPIVKELYEKSRKLHSVDASNVYQEGHRDKQALIHKIVQDLMLPGSKMTGFEHLKELYDRVQAGQAGMIVMEHYTNFDIPCLYYLLDDQGPEGEKVADATCSMAGMKLTEQEPLVAAFSDAYTRIVIYPSRSIKSIQDEEKLKQERRRSNAINMAAMKAMVRHKHEGTIILVFPAGTRYRPGHPETKRGLPEIDSYLRGFDFLVPIGTAGQILPVRPDGNMIEDPLQEDVVVYSVGEVTECEEFRRIGRSRVESGQDAKQATADAVMERLDQLHQIAEAERETSL